LTARAIASRSFRLILVAIVAVEVLHCYIADPFVPKSIINARHRNNEVLVRVHAVRDIILGAGLPPWLARDHT
jgi:hypothetical protein